MRPPLHLRFVIFVMLCALGLSAGVGSAETTMSQLVELSRAGLDDDILIALIQTDGSTFQLTTADILALHRQGLSDRVIRAMQETARAPVPAQVPPSPAGGEIDGRPVPPPPPAVVNVYPPVTQHVDEPSGPPLQRYDTVPMAVPIYVAAPIVRTPRVTAPVYWGWGGQRRPDSWQPDPEPRREPTRQTLDRNKGGS